MMDNSLTELTLIIKAANQKNEDFQIKCDLNWSVKRLKEYLCENYPTKPIENNMRLIYFGKLLHDHWDLKDFIRQSSESIVHNVHLIYTQCNNDLESKTNANANQVDGNANIQVNNTSNQSQTRLIEQLTPKQQYESIYSQLKRHYDSIGVPITNPWYSTYIQHTALYYHMNSNYMNSLGLTNQPLINNSNLSEQTILINNPPPVAPQEDQQQQPAGGVGAAVNDGEIRNEERDDDWLGLLHNICSFLVLFSIIYFYSSFTRFLLVFGAVVLLFLYHRGWFSLERRQVRNNQENANPDQAQPQQPPPQPGQQNNDEQQNSINVDVNANETNQSILTLIIRFIVSFFTSLIPERPRIAN